MRNAHPAKKASQEDWHPALVIAELRIRAGLTLATLAAQYGLCRRVMSHALYRPYPLAEARIAKALGIEPKTIWPSRYNPDGTRRHPLKVTRMAPVVNGSERKAA